jgi:hypothetical protein
LPSRQVYPDINESIGTVPYKDATQTALIFSDFISGIFELTLFKYHNGIKNNNPIKPV